VAAYPDDDSAVRLWRIADFVNAVVRTGLVVERLEELRSVALVREHDPRLPGEVALVATKGTERPAARPIWQR
jgi:hypothetical protein